MNYTYSTPWKGQSTNSVVPSNSRPYNKYDTNIPHTHGKPNPIRQWRKQLHPSFPTVSSKQISLDDADKAVYVGTDIDCENNNYKIIKENISHTPNTCSGTKINNRCVGGTNKIRRSGSTKLSKKYHSSHKSYLQSKCRTFEQTNLKGAVVDEANNIYKTTSCVDNNCNRVVYKNSNAAFKTNGPVSASTQTLRKKNNARTSNGVMFKTAYGIAPLYKKPYYTNTTDYAYRYYKANPDSKLECQQANKSC